MSEVKLLPLPDIERYEVVGDIAYPINSDPDGDYVEYDGHVLAMADYARAVAEHNVAARDAEIEALRAEVERLTFEMGCLRQQYDERTACMIVHRGSALACSAAVRAAYSEEHERAERLAEAIRAYKAECDNPAKDYVLRARRRNEMFALRDHDQEGKDG